MNSREVELQGCIERYLAGRLVGDAREAFEVFWFVSDDGFEQLQRGLRIRAGFTESEGGRDQDDAPVGL